MSCSVVDSLPKYQMVTNVASVATIMLKTDPGQMNGEVNMGHMVSSREHIRLAIWLI